MGVDRRSDRQVGVEEHGGHQPGDTGGEEPGVAKLVVPAEAQCARYLGSEQHHCDQLQHAGSPEQYREPHPFVRERLPHDARDESRNSASECGRHYPVEAVLDSCESRGEAISHPHHEQTEPPGQQDVAVHLHQRPEPAAKLRPLGCRVGERQSEGEAKNQRKGDGRTDERGVLVLLSTQKPRDSLRGFRRSVHGHAFSLRARDRRRTAAHPRPGVSRHSPVRLAAWLTRRP